MKRTQLFAAAGLLLLSPLAANAGIGFVDAYYAPSANLEITVPGLGSADDDGDGFGVRGMAPIADSFALTGEYQSNSYDDTDLDVDQLRFGGGFVGPTGSGVFVEYISMDVGDDTEADGFGVHGRLSLKPGAGDLNLFGQVGYIAVDDDSETLSGFEFSVGAAMPFNQQWGGFIDYRQSTVEGEDSDVEFEFSDFRVGLRMTF